MGRLLRTLQSGQKLQTCASGTDLSWARNLIPVGLAVAENTTICRGCTRLCVGEACTMCAMQIDLHCHSRCSDGKLDPIDLVQRAADAGVSYLSITDHDTVSAYKELANRDLPVSLIPGIEFSTQWNGKGIHVLGLDIDPLDPAIVSACRSQQVAREERARQIALKLEQKGVKKAWENAKAHAGSAGIGRIHFATVVVEQGLAEDLPQAFKRLLGDGKPASVRADWMSLEDVNECIRNAGGIPVLAHPMKYKFTRTRLLRLLGDFKAAGGRGMEVVSGRQSAQETAEMSRLCRESGLLASCGSDFHEPGRMWAELGRFPPLPSACLPVWTRFRNPPNISE